MSVDQESVRMPSENLNGDTNAIKREYIHPRGIIAIRKGGKLDPMTMTMPMAADSVRKRNWITWERRTLSRIIPESVHKLTLAKA